MRMLFILLSFAPVDAPDPPPRVVEVRVDLIDVNHVGFSNFVQHIYWQVSTAPSPNNGAPMWVLVNRGWRVMDSNDAFGGIYPYGDLFVDEFEDGGSWYRISGLLISSYTQQDVEVANRRYRNWIVP